MDLLCREYASPFALLDMVIASGRLCEWLDHFAQSHNEKLQWEHWLHKVFDQNWTDYKNGTGDASSARGPAWSESDLETTISASFDMLANFVPE